MHNETFQGTCTKGRIEASLGQEGHCLVGSGQRQLQLLVQALAQLVQYQLNDILNLLLLQGLEGDDIIHTVQEFRTEEVHQHLLNLFAVHLTLVLHDFAAAQVTGHDNQRILKVHAAALAIGQAAIVQNLQQHIEDVRMGLFDFVQQDDAVGVTAYSLSQLTALVIAHIAWRGTNQTGHGVLLHIFTHIDAHHVALIIKEYLSQGFSQLGFAYAGGA